MAKSRIKKSVRLSDKKVLKPLQKKTVSSKNKPDQTLAIIALILNILILPGLGSLIGGKTKEGIWQLVLVIIGGVLSIILIGIPLLIAAWIWGLITGIKLIRESS